MPQLEEFLLHQKHPRTGLGGDACRSDDSDADLASDVLNCRVCGSVCTAPGLNEQSACDCQRALHECRAGRIGFSDE
jgi:hypothetical protein